MRIVSITGGAAAMYCGSCFRDNALAAELMRQGHDVTLIPFYTPTLTDEANVSTDRVFFGGISVYLQQKSRLFRKLPRSLDRLWDSRWALKKAAGSSIPTDPRFLGELTVSVLRGTQGFQQKEISKLLDWLKTQPAPDIVTLPYTLLISVARPLREALNCPVVCAMQGEDLFLEGLLEPYRSQALALIRDNLDSVDAFMPVSEYYARFMGDYLDIPAAKMYVVPLGIRATDFAPAPPRAVESGVYTIGYFARVAPEKGLHLLCDAYRLMRRRPECPPSRLEVAGYCGPEHQSYIGELQQHMREWGLADEFHFRGSPDRAGKITFLHELDVFCVPTVYREPKGQFALEAMAAGVPVVLADHGAFPEMIAKTSGGLLVPPNDPDALAEALLALWRRPEERAEMGRRGLEGVRKFYSVEQMARRTLEVFAAARSGAPAMASH